MTSVDDQLLKQLTWRYATQKFDPARRIPDDTWAALERSLVLTPSSFGLQPWRFAVVTSEEVRKQLVACSFGQAQVRDASHVVAFAIRKNLDASHVDRHIDRVVELRAAERESLERYRKITVGYVSSLPEARQEEWSARQVYIALGAFMTAAAMLGVDTCPMEGIIPDKYDELLGLDAQGYATVVACCAGYRAADDKYAALPKVRFDPNDVITRIE